MSRSFAEPRCKGIALHRIHTQLSLVQFSIFKTFYLQALVKIIDDISNEEIRTLEIPTGVPLIYELSNDLKPVRHYHVG